MIGYCPGCKPHKYQDAKYKGNRVMNPTTDGGHRCTVCGSKSGSVGKK